MIKWKIEFKFNFITKFIMKFPDDIWKEIFTYYHSVYKKPLHFVGIMNCSVFYQRRCINLYWSLNPIRSFISRTNHGIFDSFYIWIILDNMEQSNPKIKINRKVAKGCVLDDFRKIWQEYAQNSSQGCLMSRIQY